MGKAPLVLMILDGWGDRVACNDNAISQAHPVYFDSLKSSYPSTLLKCSGKDVGLPGKQMGNSEVGHLNMGSGRTVFQEITRINDAIEKGSFFRNEEFIKAMQYARDNGGAVHLMGLLSDGGVHSHLEHLYALLKLCKMQGVDKVFIHGLLDGRDVGPKSAREYINQLEAKLEEIGLGKIATLSGRYYGMDRDNRWERIEKYYNALVAGEGVKAPNAFAAIENSYEARVTDEFVEPVVIIDNEAHPTSLIQDGDSLIFFNFRADRARQISKTFVEPDFNRFDRKRWPQIHYLCMTHYDDTIEAPVAFPPQNLQNTLGEVLANEGLRQLRIAETEKYAHVTFFFNGGVENPNQGEERVLIPSPDVATYNLKPEMSAFEVTARVLEEIDRDIYDVIIMNYANPDMVGHTGVLDAAVKAVKTVDECLIRVVNKIREKSGIVIITADHGNCEMMVSPETGAPFTAHTTDLVPFILVSDQHKEAGLRSRCSLRDIAPTMLKLLGISIPEEMTGQNIIKD
ncbi:MAG: 2,3-bisphosphoglycerate-independent phosphoglycerate mutase [Syntrophomonadaceae bacterium]|nr:2,3-bisphosphoglycerate-independent phosphoglycerate mutase [Syntrophomonadaceae bacterium]MDD3889239.1 2,3-bisphosphoglycerate-independent phosphoglycerate mutase [Syntrophomonadaceae bacterium]MDD4549773.1 2,3-bisphosphoglycerate-independent phosphoglycerate mutase [Syntrophomonadaceae bacterium]